MYRFLCWHGFPCFHRKSPKMAKMAQNHLKKGGTPFFARFLSCTSTTGLKKHHFGACGGSPKKIIEVQDGRMGGGTYSTPGPVLTSFSVRYRAARPCCRRNLKKKWRPPPAAGDRGHCRGPGPLGPPLAPQGTWATGMYICDGGHLCTYVMGVTYVHM